MKIIKTNFNDTNCSFFQNKNDKGLMSDGKYKFKIYVDYDAEGVFDDFDMFMEEVDIIEWHTKGISKTEQLTILEEFGEFWHNNYNKK